MVLSEQTTVILFKLLNFVVLSGLVIYGVMVYIMPDLRAQMKKYIAYIKGLRSSHRSLQKDVRVMQQAMSKDEKEQDHLKKNVKHWQAVVQAERDDLLRERDGRKEALLKRFEEHREHIALYRVYKQVVPEAIEQARQQLEKQFAREGAQQQFMKKFMRDLRRQ